MAGHSHWKSIKHRKGAADQRRGKLFSKLAKYIMVAAKNGGGNPADNLRLRYAIEKARAESMPKDSIERAIKKGTGELQGEELVELTYEGIGPAGTAIVVEALTDNRNRTSGEVRNLLEKRGASLGKANSVLWKFERKGVLGVLKAEFEEEEILEVALEAGADDMEEEEENFFVHAPPETFDRVRGVLEELINKKRGKGEKKWGEAEDDRPHFTRDELAYIPLNPVPVTEPAAARSLLDLLGEIEDHEDVQSVFCDADIPEATVETLSAEQ